MAATRGRHFFGSGWFFRPAMSFDIVQKRISHEALFFCNLPRSKDLFNKAILALNFAQFFAFREIPKAPAIAQPRPHSSQQRESSVSHSWFWLIKLQWKS
jgi:hypothetical protein